MRIVRLLLILATLAPLASVAHGADDWKALHRRLHLPPASGACPTSPTRLLGNRPYSVAAPVYLMNVGSAPVPGTIDISPWLVPASYRGPVLIRAARIDGARPPVALAKVYAQHLSELRFRTGESNGARGRVQGLPGRYRFLASSAGFRAPGCYAFQIDGLSFSSVIVMRVQG